MIKTKFSNPEELIDNISLEELKQTLSEESLGRKRKRNLFIDHHSFIEDVEERLDKRNLKMKREDIIISRKGLGHLPALDPGNDYKLNSIIVRNLIASFNLMDMNNNDMNMKVALSYTEQGLSVALGANIKICSNMTIMSPQHYFRNYGADKIPQDKFFELLDHNLDNMESSWSFYEKGIPKLKEIKANNNIIYDIVGKLSKMAVTQTYGNESNSPFNIGDSNTFIRNLNQKRYFDDKSNVSMFDVMQVGTELLTHDVKNISEKTDVLTRLGSFIADYNKITLYE